MACRVCDERREVRFVLSCCCDCVQAKVSLQNWRDAVLNADTHDSQYSSGDNVSIHSMFKLSASVRLQGSQSLLQN
jgi:hypothetical protein